jgi:hypothetical protein
MPILLTGEAEAFCPDLPAVNRKALDLIEELIRSKADAEGKLALLKGVVLAIDADPSGIS